MPQANNAPKSPMPPKPGNEPSMDMRLMLAFLLMGVVLMLTQYFYKPEQKAIKPVDQATKQQAATPAPPAPPKLEDTATAAAAGTARPATPAGRVAAQKEEIFTIDTALYRVEFTNQGAVARSWILKKYLDNTGKPLQLVNQAAKDLVWYPFTLDFVDQKPPVDVNQALFLAKPAGDGKGIDYQYSDGSVVVTKAFRFNPASYLLQVRTEASVSGVPAPHLLQWRGGFGDPVVHNAWSTQQTAYFDPSANKLRTNAAKAAKDGPVSASGSFEFGGIEDTFFAAVFLPRQPGAPMTIRTYSDKVPVANGAPQQEQHVGSGVGGASPNQYALFVGPKDPDLLQAVDPKLGQIVNWGWFGFLAKPIFYSLNWINERHVHNYGWSIVIVTVIINILLLPLKFWSLKSAKKMQALQPHIKSINEKYKDVGMRDPKKTKQNEELMALYKQHGVNPMGGCLPMLPQLPFLYAFYTVLTVSISMRGAHWLWVTDLSQPESLAIRVLPVLLVITSFIMQKMTPAAPGGDPSQQKMMMFMPLLFGFMFYSLSSGLVLYWLTSNLVGIAQQWIVNRVTPAPAVPPPPAPPARKARK